MQQLVIPNLLLFMMVQAQILPEQLLKFLMTQKVLQRRALAHHTLDFLKEIDHKGLMLNRMMGLMDLLSVELLGWRFLKCCFFCWYLICIAYAAIYLLCLLEGFKACKLWEYLTILSYVFIQCLTFNLI